MFRCKITFLFCLLFTLSLGACSPENERDKDDRDTSLPEEVDASQDTELDTEEDIEKDIEEDIEEDVEEDIEEDVEEDIEEDIEEDTGPEPIPPCTITESATEITVNCPDGTAAIFDATLANNTDALCERVAHDDGPDTIVCNEQDSEAASQDGFTLTSPLGLAYLAHRTELVSRTELALAVRPTVPFLPALTIDAPGLISLTLPSLTYLQGDLVIYDQDLLTHFSFPALSTITAELFIQGNQNLTNLDGLSALTTLNTVLTIDGNPSLVDISGLAQLTTTHSVYIRQNDKLASLQGLHNIISLNGNFDIRNNAMLTNLAGLDSLKSINGNLEVAQNAELLTPTGLNSLENVSGYLMFRDHPKLENLNGLDTLNAVGSHISIYDNPSLCQSTVIAWIAAFKARSGGTNAEAIPGNKNDC